MMRTLEEAICGVDLEIMATETANRTAVFARLCCVQISVVHTFAFPASQVIMLFMAIDRLIALRNPLRYANRNMMVGQ